MLKRLFKRNLKKNQEIEQKVAPKHVKKDSFTEKLGIPFSLNEIEFISIFAQDLEDPMYYIGVSNRERLEILTETRRGHKDAILEKFEELKSNFKAFGNFVSLGEGLPLINIHRVDNIELVWDERDSERNHCRIRLSNGNVYLTKSEIYIGNHLNFNEWLAFTFASARNDSLYGK
ncbi:MAG: hypothetical protein J6Q13_02435 [Clostridia bacterium]|nr:hypothetical protein [Clostridia bacterium]